MEYTEFRCLGVDLQSVGVKGLGILGVTLGVQAFGILGVKGLGYLGAKGLGSLLGGGGGWALEFREPKS